MVCYPLLWAGTIGRREKIRNAAQGVPGIEKHGARLDCFDLIDFPPVVVAVANPTKVLD
jgi:hypothetical protein